MTNPKADLRRIGDLTERQMGKRVTVTIADADVTGTLAGTIPLRDEVRLVLVVAGARLFTPSYAADTVVEVHRAEATA